MKGKVVRGKFKELPNVRLSRKYYRPQDKTRLV